MKDFWVKFNYLLDGQDKVNFIKFVLLLFFGGIISLLGIGAVIPFIRILVDPVKAKYFTILGSFTYVQGIVLCSIMLIFSFWIKNLFIFLIAKWQAIFLNELSSKVRKKLFYQYIYSPYIYHVKRSSPDLINTISVEVGILSSNIIIQGGSALNEAVMSGIVFIALLYMNPVFSLIIAGGIVLSVKLLMNIFQSKNAYYGELRAQSYVTLTQSILQGLGGVKEIKIYHKEPYFVDQVSVSSDAIAKSSAFSSIFQQAPRFLVELVAVTIVLCVLIVFVIKGNSASQILVLISVFGVAAVQLLPSINRLTQSFACLRYGYAALLKVYNEMKQMDAEIKNVNVKGAQDPIIFNQAIYLDKVSFAYSGKIVLDNIELTLPKGRTIAFVGESGAGKTTLVDIILGVLQPNQGGIYVDGELIAKNNLRAWQSHFGYIPQLIYVYDNNIRENIAFGMSASEIDDTRVWESLRLAALSDFVRTLPDGLYTLVGENGIRLSGGQRQRIGIARALYRDPDILVMDEATAALDNQTEHEITQALENAEKGRTTITIAHRLSTIKYYDIIHVMDKGRVIASGTYGDLLGCCEKFKEMVYACERN